MKIKCAHCGKRCDKPAGAVNRSLAAGMRLFCDRRCSGLAKRQHKTKAQRVAEKAAYDAKYRRKNFERIKAGKREHFRRTYDPVKAAIERKKTMKRHVEYCRRPEYKQWKRWYDAEYRAKEYGEFAEAYKTVVDLNREIKKRIKSYEKHQQNQTGIKAQRRRREDGQERSYGHSAAFG